MRASPEDMVRQATAGLSDSLRQTLMEAAERGTDERPSAVRKTFEKFCREHKVTIADKPPASGKATAAWRAETGYGADVLVRRGRLSDLIFLRKIDELQAKKRLLQQLVKCECPSLAHFAMTQRKSTKPAKIT